jgi:membrane-associated phospholipid phosphatase
MLILGLPITAAAQGAMAADSDSVATSSVRHPKTAIRPWHAAVAVGGIAVLSLLDEPLHRATQNMRTSTTDDVASVFRHMGQPEVYATVGLGTIGVGLIAGNRRITQSGIRISSSLLLAGVAGQIVKRIVGRWRPYETDNAYTFTPFTTQHDAFYSGHTTMAFALAASVSDEVHKTWVTVGLYTFATGTAWSRMNDEKHWFTDGVTGALMGIASAKFVNGQWRVFGISAPRFLLGPEGAGFSVTLPMPIIH